MGALADSVRLNNRWYDCAYMNGLYASSGSASPEGLQFLGERSFLRKCMEMTFKPDHLQVTDVFSRSCDTGRWLMDRYWDCAGRRVMFYQENNISTPDDFRFANLTTRCEGGVVFKECMNEPRDPAEVSCDNTMHNVVLAASLALFPASILLAARAWGRGERLKAAGFVALSVGTLAIGVKAMFG